MNLLEAIHSRSSVRAFRYRPIEPSALQQLLEAAVRAPSAFDEQPWAFVVVEDRVLLRKISETTKALWAREEHRRPPNLAAGLPPTDPRADSLWDPGFDLLYGAAALIVIGVRGHPEQAQADCWLAAENLLLAAHASGLGGCIVTSVLPALRTVELRNSLHMPAAFQPVVPLVVGTPKESGRPRPRRPPEVLAWHR